MIKLVLESKGINSYYYDFKDIDSYKEFIAKYNVPEEDASMIKFENVEVDTAKKECEFILNTSDKNIIKPIDDSYLIGYIIDYSKINYQILK